MEPDGYTLDEAAELLGIDPRRVALWVADGRLPVVAPGIVAKESVHRERERRDSRSLPRRTWERVKAVLKWMP